MLRLRAGRKGGWDASQYCFQSSAEEQIQHGLLDPKKGHKDDQEDAVPPLWGQATRVEVIQPLDKKVPGRPY